MAIWWNATLYPFAQIQQTNPYWINAWHWSVGRTHPPTLFGFNPDTPDETFFRWIFWDNLSGLFFLGLSMGFLSAVCGMIRGDDRVDIPALDAALTDLCISSIPIVQEEAVCSCLSWLCK